jgi:hypothetical protein
MDGWARIKDGAKYSDVSERTFRDWIKGDLKHSRLPSGTILVRYSWIDEFLEKYQADENQVDRIVDQAVKEIQSGR